MVARALMKAHEGEIVEVRARSGVEQIEVLEILYGGPRGEAE
jgi:transcription elongation GreA/GreB family factor